MLSLVDPVQAWLASARERVSRIWPNVRGALRWVPAEVLIGVPMYTHIAAILAIGFIFNALL